MRCFRYAEQERSKKYGLSWKLVMVFMWWCDWRLVLAVGRYFVVHHHCGYSGGITVFYVCRSYLLSVWKRSGVGRRRRFLSAEYHLVLGNRCSNGVGTSGLWCGALHYRGGYSFWSAAFQISKACVDAVWCTSENLKISKRKAPRAVSFRSFSWIG